MRSRKRRRDNAWPTAEEKSSKIRKLEVVVGTVKDRKEKARKISSTQDIKEKVKKVEGEQGMLAPYGNIFCLPFEHFRKF